MADNLKIDLSYNSMQWLQEESIPKDVEILDLSNNHLYNFPDFLLNLKNLRILKMQNNHILNLPKDIGKMQQLEELDLSFNKIRFLPKSFEELNDLKILKLEGNPINWKECEGESLTLAMEKISSGFS